MEDVNNKEIVDLVIARLKTIPSDAGLSVGTPSSRTFTVDELISQVRNGTEIGKKVIETQLFFLRSLQDLPIADVIEKIRTIPGFEKKTE